MRGAAYLGSYVAMVAGLCLWAFAGSGVGLVVLVVGCVGWGNAWLYNRRWLRLQGEVFTKRETPRWRRRFGLRLLRWAGAVDPGLSLKASGMAFTFEKAKGVQVWGPVEQVRGCPLWYLWRDYPLADEQAVRPW